MQLNTDYKDVRNDIVAERVFYTGALDEYFDYADGMLPYRSLYFDILTKNVPNEQPTATINYSKITIGPEFASIDIF